MTPEQRAEWSEWCRQRANDLQLLQFQDFENGELEARLNRVELQLYTRAETAARSAQDSAYRARKDLEALATRIEADAD